MRVFIAAVMALWIGYSFQPALAARDLPAPKLVVVYFYADWCPNCKPVSKALVQAREQGELDKKAILFVTLNLTDTRTIHQAVLLSQALGVGAFVQAQGSATGYIAVLDASHKRELSRFDRDSTPKHIIATLNGFLAP